MSMEIKQTLRQTQQLVMTPQLQQAIKLLQLTRMELLELVREEMTENPVLEDTADGPSAGEEPVQDKRVAAEPDEGPQTPRDAVAEVKGDEHAVGDVDWENYLTKYADAPPMPAYRPGGEELPPLEATLTRRPSLVDHLMDQLKLSSLPDADRAIANLIIGNIDADGYVKEPPIEQIAHEMERSVEDVERVLKKVQEFDPVGVAARTLEECLLLQARHLEIDDEIVVHMIGRHLGSLEKKNYQAIARDLKQPMEEIVLAAKAIQALSPFPGRQYSEEEPVYITPDVYVHKLGEKYFVVTNDDGLPKLKISGFYRGAMSHSPKVREYIKEKMRSAAWLIRSIQQRQRTIVKVTESIVKFQREFFDRGIGHLKPLILRDVADDIAMHESTISRVTTNKYVHTPHGIYELKFFFNSGINRTDGDAIASESVKDKIKGLVQGEDGEHPHSDQRLVELLRADGIDIARRTVAKYREQLGILSSSKRRQVF
jgi:RNA polymerase sigma-54 factor